MTAEATHKFREIDLFPGRPAAERRKALEARKPRNYASFGPEYFDAADGTYGGYTDDGRFAVAAKNLVKAFDLKPGDTVLELGCAKGFLLHELHKLGMDVRGLDISAYAVDHAPEPIKDRVRCRTIGATLPYRDGEFRLVFAKELLPHLNQWTALSLAKHISRVGKDSFLEIQCAPTEESAVLMRRWDSTHRICRPANWWRNRLRHCGYMGALWFKDLF